LSEDANKAEKKPPRPVGERRGLDVSQQGGTCAEHGHENQLAKKADSGWLRETQSKSCIEIVAMTSRINELWGGKNRLQLWIGKRSVGRKKEGCKGKEILSWGKRKPISLWRKPSCSPFKLQRTITHLAQGSS